MKIQLACALAAIIVAGCATQPPPRMVWIRTDGQGTSDPVRAQQFEIDRMVCNGDTSKAGLAGLNPVTPYKGGYSVSVDAERTALSNNVMHGCMADKGYVLVREDEAEARTAQFAAVAAEKVRREAAVKQPPASAKRTNTPRPQVAEATR
jgi:hypothetical protein